MRTKWLNLILHTSSLIQKSKNELLLAHGLNSILKVILLILMTFFYVIISVPFTLLVKGDKETIKLKESLTLSFLLPVTIIWIVKLLLVMVFLLFLDYSWFDIELSEIKEDSTSLRIYELMEDQEISIPTNTEFKLITFPRLVLEIRGEAVEDDISKILVGFVSKNSPRTRYFVGNIKEDGTWIIEKSFNLRESLEGIYELEVSSIKEEEGTRSTFSYIGDLEFETPVWFSILQSFDMYLNYLIVFFVGISVCLTLIII